MGEKTGISWCDHTYNISWGCQKVSAGCDHCYAETLARRMGHAVWGPPATTGRRTFGEAHWREPLRWEAAAAAAGVRRRVFCSSMADVFETHPQLDAERAKLWPLIEATPHLDWLLLTKRPQSIRHMLPAAWLAAPRPNVWLGTSTENQEEAARRIPHLLATPAGVRWLSCEPLLGPLDLRGWLAPRRIVFPVNAWGDIPPPDPCRLHWVITGGESGPGYRPMDPDWVLGIRDQCAAAGVAFFHKQGAGLRPGRDREIDGLLHEAWPMATAVPS